MALAALLPAAGAHAQPASDAADVFGESPRLLTKKQLDSLEFRVRFHEDWLERAEEVQRRMREQPDDAELKERVQRQKQRRAELEKSPIGIFLPQTEYHLDEPVRAYFAVKNATEEVVGLDMRLDLQLRLRTVNECSVDLRRLDKAEVDVSLIRERLWECGGPPRLTLPPGGYYCTRADLRRLGANAAGKYAIRWNYSGLVSQEVKFTILPAKRDGMIQRPIHTVCLANIERADEEVEQTAERPPPPVIQSARLTPLPFPQFAAALSTGAHGRLYPDVLELPRQDRFVSASLHLEMPRDGGLPKALILTLTPRQKNEGLFLEDFDHLVLVVVSRSEVQKPAREIALRERLQRAKRLENGYSLADPDKPLKIRVELEQDWPRRLGLSGPLELRLLLSSEPVKLQGRWPELRRLESRVLYASPRKPWKGLLCTPAVHVDAAQP
jgi:hypothetical protein